MSRYYVNKNAQANGDHEVHQSHCSYFPNKDNAVYLGTFTSCHSAVAEAKRQGHKKANGCYFCSKECHTS